MGKSPLRTVLKNFLDHYQNLEESLKKSRLAIKEMAGRQTPPPLSLYAQEFLKLKELTESLKNDSNCPMVEGHSDVNKKKNRYKDILPYDNSRVILSEYPGVPGSDYINANYVRGSSGNQRAYIASQGPLPNTLVDFWRMIWETEVLVIVMACNEREAGKYKCEPYWPLNTEEKQQYGNITVEHVKWRQVCPDFLVRTFKVSADNNEERTICQFHYTTWPDHGVPSSVQPILELVRLMRDVQSSESRPILVHCSAGCGRTGTICSIDYVWALLRTGKLREDFSLFDIISDMRRQRIAMVQTVEQYMLCYKAVATLFEQHLKLIDSHTYENVDDDGEPLGIKDQQQSVTTPTTRTASVDQPETTTTRRSKSLSSLSSSSSSSSSESLNTEISNRNQELQQNQEVSIQNLGEKESSSSSSESEDNADDDNDDNCAINVEESRLCEATRPHEKLIGKATVIRRPSIAKLKAIFDNNSNCHQNNNSNNNNNDGNNSDSNTNDINEIPTTSRATRLQRSQSIKENFRNFNFNFHLEINQPKLPSRKSKSYTLSAAKLSVYKKNLSFANLVLNPEKNRTKVTDICFDPPPSTSTSSSKSNDLETRTETKERIKESDVMVDQQQQQQSVIPRTQNTTNPTFSNNIRFNSRPPSLNEANRGAPPKPPRTYQHVVDDSCIIKTSEGRLIVTVAQPRHHQHQQHNNHQFRQQQDLQNSDCGTYDQADSMIYEQLGARKFSYQSSPNLAIATDRINFIPTGASFHQMSQQPPQAAVAPPQLQQHYSNPNAIYSNPMISKSFPLPMFTINNNGGNNVNPQQQQQQSNKNRLPPANNLRPSNEFVAYGNYSPFVDVLNNQHFQQHQAKPILLQQHGYYEPIYGTANNNNHHHQQFLNQRSSQPLLPPHCSNILQQPQPPPLQQHGMIQQPPNRSKSMTVNHRPIISNHQHHQSISETIYSNREMCFNMNPLTNRVSYSDSNSINVPSIKENIYTEINLKQQQNNNNTAIPQETSHHHSIKSDDNQSSSNNSVDNNANQMKNGRFDKFRRVFKILRFKGTSSSSQNQQTPNKSSTSASSTTKISSNDNNRIINNNNTNTTANKNNNIPPNTLKITAPNGIAINPINGQPLTRPPHCHRFQNSAAAATQWTQV